MSKKLKKFLKKRKSIIGNQYLIDKQEIWGSSLIFQYLFIFSKRLFWGKKKVKLKLYKTFDEIHFLIC